MSEQAPLFQPKTKNGYSLDEVASSLQKEIRRGNEENALYWALELFPYFAGYAWKRLSVISVEDIEDPKACQTVSAMRDSFFHNNEKKKAEDFQNRIFITKAVLFLCREKKSREADHAQFYIDELHQRGDTKVIPDYAFDVHTKSGRIKGKTKKNFLFEEQEGLNEKGRDDYFNKLDVIKNGREKE